jgi:hypothetical protein
MNRICIYICISLLVIYILCNRGSSEEQFSLSLSRSSKTSSVIRSSGNFNLMPNTTYYFDMPEDMSYLMSGKPRDKVSLYLPKKVQDGDTIILIDKSNRFGWGNLSYDYRIILEDNKIRGTLSDLNLFPYRGGHVIFVWNEKDYVWESNGYKGNIENVWNGWYTLEYKGFLPSFTPGTNPTMMYPSYMRIDATQNPILITYYGGTEMYPVNLVFKASVGELKEDQNEIIFPVYPLNLSYAINMTVPKLKRLKNGIILDLDKGGGWKKKLNISINTIPSDFHELN